MTARSNKCPSCGKQHVPGFTFCQRCGGPLGADLGGNAPRRHTNDGEEEEATDLYGRILDLLERGKRMDAIRLYHEVLAGDIKVAEAAIDELAKNNEFAEVPPDAPSTVKRQQTRAGRNGRFGAFVAAIKTLMGLDRG